MAAECSVSLCEPLFLLSDVDVELMLVCSLKLNTMSVIQLSVLPSLICMNSDCLLASTIYFYAMCAVKTEQTNMTCRGDYAHPDHMARMSGLITSWLLTTTTYLQLSNGRLY